MPTPHKAFACDGSRGDSLPILLFARRDIPHTLRPVESAENKQRIIREAAALMGTRELAGRLGVSMDDVSAWVDGTVTVPDALLVSLSEILLSWSGKQRF